MDYKFLHPYSNAANRAPFTLTHAVLANLDASTGEEIDAVGCDDQGGNKNVRFLSEKP